MRSERELDRLKAALPKSIEPPRDLWPQIADRISRGKVVAGEFGKRSAPPVWRRPAWLAAAAAVALVVTTSAITTVILRNRLPAGAAIPTPRGLVQDFASVETEYLSATSEILRAVHAGEVQLSPATVAILEKNLQVIDDALRESRDALTRDPANSALREMVLGSYRQKLDLLRRVTAGRVELWSVARAVGTLLALSLALSGAASAQMTVNRRVALAPDASIRVFNLEGSIKITGWAKDSLVVTGTLSPGGGKLFYFGGGGHGAKLGVEPRSSGEADGPSNLEVFVPAKSKVWIKAATAEVSVTGFSGSLDIYSVSGSIRVDGSPAQVYAESMDGNIEVTGSAPWVRAKTASGAITITGGGEDVAANTVSGAMTIQGARVVRGRFESVTGDIRFDGDVDRGASLTFESHSGVVELRLPSSVSADFNVNEFQGKIVNELTSAVARPVRDRGGQELTFTMGQGGADVTIRNFKGAVLLRKKK